jgi:ribosomal protein L5
MNNMQEIRIEKITLNIGCGKDQSRIEKGIKLLKNIAQGSTPVKTITKKRIPEWGLRPKKRF